MDGQMDAEKSKEVEYVCKDSLKSHVENGKVTVHSKDIDPPISIVGCISINKGASLHPETPNPNRENGDSPFECTSPLSPVSSPTLEVHSFESPTNESSVAASSEDSPRTPKDGVFDPFAPGPDKMVLAPICNKLAKRSQPIVARRLNFDDADEYLRDGDDGNNGETVADDAMLLDLVYGSVLDILVKLTQDYVAESHPQRVDGVNTPASPPHLTGIAETCPGAPAKSEGSKTRNIDPSICRKLEF